MNLEMEHLEFAIWCWINVILVGLNFEWCVVIPLQAKLASILASFIIHKPPQRSPFSKAAFKTVGSTLIF